MSDLPDEPRRRTELTIPWSTVGKILVAALLVWAFLKLWLPFLVFLVAVLIAVTLSPIVAWLERRKISHGVAVVVVGLVLFGIILAFAIGVLPPLIDQLLRLGENFPTYRTRVESHIRADHPFLQEIVNEVFELPSSPEIKAWLDKPLLWGKVAVGVVALTFFLFVLSMYLLLDGKRVYAWILAYVPRRYRARMGRTIPEVSDVVFAYVGGQILTSILTVFVTFGILAVFRVPAALPLALLAGIADVIPIVGVVISTAPAVLMALTVSPVAAAGVLVLYVLYHVLETYVIIPRIYGRRLQLSTLAVLLALVVGGTLQGILGAILVLPLVAAYPIIERIWLHEYLSDEVLRDHAALEEAAVSGSDAAVRAVLRGQRHEGEVTDEKGVLPSNRR
ncbi:MAG TPA: AI-2E family transporter [Thermoanaerobaculia bacterium]|nr:AI-2E family transporter [Thermoanaerobaculia bacterium]